MRISPAYVLDGPTVLLFAGNSLYLTDRLYLPKMACRKRKRWHFISQTRNLKNFSWEHAPSRPPCLGRLGLANFSSPARTFKISCYTANYRLLIAYEINAQGWKKRLSLEGVGMVWGAYILKFVIVKRGGTIFICNYFGGVQF